MSALPLKADIGRSQPARSFERLTRRLPGVGFRDLAHQLGPVHVERPVDRTGLGTTVVFEDFDHEGRVV